MYSIVVSTYPSLLALGLYSSQPLQPLEPQNSPPKEMRLSPPLRPAEPGQCLPPLHMCIGRTYSKNLREMLTFISLRETLTFISIREMPSFISLRSIKLATHPIPPRKKLGPRYLATHRIPSRKSSGPDTDPTQRKPRAPMLGPHSAQEDTRAQAFGPRFCSGENSGPGTRGQIPCVSISRVPLKAHALVLQSSTLSVII